MRSIIEWKQILTQVEEANHFVAGYKLLYCPWNVIETANVAFISLNPGRAPDDADLRCVSDERGNSYEIERATTKSRITEQFLSMANFLGVRPAEILTGVVVPFRGDRWDDFDTEQKRVGLELGMEFWEEVLSTGRLRLIILSAGVAPSKRIIKFLQATLEETRSSGWGNTSVSRYRSPKGVRIVSLPHLSTYQLFSCAASLEPLKRIFQLQ